MAVSVKLTFSTDTYTVKEFDLPAGTQLRAAGNLIMDDKGKVVEMVDVQKPRREIEVVMLKNLAEAAYSKAKSMSDIHVCSDLYAQFDSLGGAAEIVLQESDTKLLCKAFEELGEKRPGGWCQRCAGMIAQLSSPQKV